MDTQEEAGDAAKNTATMEQASNAGRQKCSNDSIIEVQLPGNNDRLSNQPTDLLTTDWLMNGLMTNRLANRYDTTISWLNQPTQMYRPTPTDGHEGL